MWLGRSAIELNKQKPAQYIHFLQNGKHEYTEESPSWMFLPEKVHKHMDQSPQ